MSQIRRNDPCSCGSGKKYKNCCGKTEASLTQKRHEGLKARSISSAASQSMPNSPLTAFAKRAFKVIVEASTSPVLSGGTLSEHNFSQGPVEKKETAPKEKHSLEGLIGIDEK